MVDAGTIPPEYFETPYYLVPDERGKKVYALLRETMRAAGKVGVGQVTIRTTHHLAAVVPSGEVLLMITMRYVNQIREHSEFEFPSTSAKSTGVTAKEMELARKLIDDMAGPWKPEAFEDTYNDDLMRRIKEKVKAGETKVLTKPESEKGEPRGAKVIDLMELLKQSIGKADGRGRKAGNGAGKRDASVTKVTDAPKARARKALTAHKAAEAKPAARRKRA